MQCGVCSEFEHDPALARRGRSGRPYQTMVKHLRRDGAHLCWICGQRIDMSLPVNDVMSWTLDHVLPLAIYPCLGLDPMNHREAHRRCNSSKGKRAGATKRSPQSREW